MTTNPPDFHISTVAAAQAFAGTNPLIYDGEHFAALETATRMPKMLQFMSGAVLSDIGAEECGQEAVSMILECCCQAAEFIAEQTANQK